VWFDSANYNTLRNNTIAENRGYNVGIFAKNVRLSSYTQDIDTSNTVNGKPIYYLMDQEGLTIDSSDIGYLGLVNCTNIQIKNVTLSGNGQGLLLAFTSNSTIENSTIVDNKVGIHVLGSDANTIATNNVTGNRVGVNLYLSSLKDISRNIFTGDSISIGVLITGLFTIWQGSSFPCEDNRINGNIMLNGGISLSNRGVTRTMITNNLFMEGSVSLSWAASNNTIYHNNFINTYAHVDTRAGNCTNIWDNGYPSGGNFWSNYNGTDNFSGVYQSVTGSDGIGDEPYIIDEVNEDKYPLVRPIFLLPGDVNLDGIVNIFDLMLGVNAYQSKPGDPNWNPFADLAPIFGKIDLFDLVTINYHYGEKY
jgi:parallel beta-helix repeat protein